MKYIEYNLCELDNTEIDLKEKITKAIENNVSCICVPFAFTKLCKSLIKNTSIILANPIDYPLGLSDTESRGRLINNAISNGATKINIVIQNNYLSTRKYEKIKEDIQQNYEICSKNKVLIDYYIEYRVFTHQSLIKACSILTENNIQNVYVSTGYFLDDPDDNLIATILLRDKSKINTIFSGNIWTKKHVENLQKNNVDNIAVNNLQSIKILNQYS